MDIWSDPLLVQAIVAVTLAGIACAVVGVMVVAMRLSFIGVCMSHAAFAGALAGLLFHVSPIWAGFGAALLAAAVLGPLADRGELSPDTAIGIVFSSSLGAAFLLLALLPGPRTQALGLLWGSVLTVTQENLWLLGAAAAASIALCTLFFKEIQTVIFSRDLARALGMPATAVFYGMLVLAGFTTTSALTAIGGLLVFSLIVTPAAAAARLTHHLGRMFIYAACFGVLAGWSGLALSWWTDLPAGALIILSATAIYAVCAAFRPSERLQ